jgi:AsmA protein
LKRWAELLLVFVGLAVVVAVASIPLFVNANTFRPAIEKQLTTTLGRSVKIGDLSLSLFSGSLVAKDISIADNPSFNAAPFLTAKELRIGVSLRLLIFSRQVNLRSFQFEAPQITVIRAMNGTWNFSSIGPFAGTAHAGSVISKGLALELSDLPVGRIVIEDGRAVIASLPEHGQTSVYEHLNLTARNVSFASQFPFELSVNLPAGGTMNVTGHLGPINRENAATSPADAQISVKRFDPVAAGFLDPNAGLSLLANIDMHAASDGQTLITSGTVHIQNLKLRKGARAAPKPLDLAYSGTHRLKDNSGEIEDATAKIGDAAIHVNGKYLVALDVEDPLLNLKLAGQNLPIDELQSLMTAAAVRLPNGSVLKGGTLSMNLAITGDAKSLAISGPVALDNTRLVGFDIGSKIHGIAALSGVKTGDTTDFEKLRVNVRITNAGVVADKIDAVIPAMGVVTGSGTVSPADQLDFNLLVKVASAKGIGNVGMGLLTKFNGPGGTSGNVSGVPMRMIGTPEDPDIIADVGGVVHRKIKSIASMFGKKNSSPQRTKASVGLSWPHKRAEHVTN